MRYDEQSHFLIELAFMDELEKISSPVSEGAKKSAKSVADSITRLALGPKPSPYKRTAKSTAAEAIELARSAKEGGVLSAIEKLREQASKRRAAKASPGKYNQKAADIKRLTDLGLGVGAASLVLGGAGALT